MTKEIPLTKGKMAIVDDDDFERVSKRSWYYHPNGYAINIERVMGHKKTVYMHRFIIGDIGRLQVDHQNGNKLDNRKSNLRPCTVNENQANSGKRKKNTSGYCGVSRQGGTKEWYAKIGFNKNTIWLGSYDTPDAAARAYDAAARVAFGEFAKLNFD